MTRRTTARQSLNRMYGISEEETKPISSTSHNDFDLHRGSSCNSLQLSTSLSVTSTASNQTDCPSLDGSIRRAQTAPLQQTPRLQRMSYQSRLSLDAKMASQRQQSSSCATPSAKPTYQGETLRPANVQSFHADEKYPASTSPQVYLCSSEDLQSESDVDPEEDTKNVSVPPTFLGVGNAASPNAFIQQNYTHKCPTCGCSNRCGLQTQQNDFHTDVVSGDSHESSTQRSRWWYFGTMANKEDSRYDDSRVHLWYFGPRPMRLSPDQLQGRESIASSRRKSKRNKEVVPDFV